MWKRKNTRKRDILYELKWCQNRQGLLDISPAMSSFCICFFEGLYLGLWTSNRSVLVIFPKKAPKWDQDVVAALGHMASQPWDAVLRVHGVVQSKFPDSAKFWEIPAMLDEAEEGFLDGRRVHPCCCDWPHGKGPRRRKEAEAGNLVCGECLSVLVGIYLCAVDVRGQIVADKCDSLNIGKLRLLCISFQLGCVPAWILL